MLNERIYMKGWVCSTGVALKFREHEKISCYVREEALMKKIKEINALNCHSATLDQSRAFSLISSSRFFLRSYNF